MPSIADTIRRLQADNPATSLIWPTTDSGRLSPIEPFGTNPGALNGWAFVPPVAGAMALVVVLHGCTQTAADYDEGAGWSALAEQHGFAVLYPEQQRANNPNLCFNWFNAEDTRRGGGESESIRQMIVAMTERHDIDPARVFVTGLSAGGAMTSAMLASYPELFAGGGIIAGLPYGAAASLPDALARMRGQGHPGAEVYADRVRAASAHRGPWPTVSVWHGVADQVVTPDNADHIVAQWRVVHGVGAEPDRSDLVDGQVRRVWLDGTGREVIEEYRIAGMGHGTPLKTRGADGIGMAKPHMIEAGISSTRRLATRWGVVAEVGVDRPPHPARTPAPLRVACERVAQLPRAVPPLSSVQATIEAALRKAGLLK